MQLGAAALLGAGLVLVLLRAVPGRAGLWLEIGTATCTCYAAGAAAGAVLRAVVARPKPGPAAQPRSDGSGSPSYGKGESNADRGGRRVSLSDRTGPEAGSGQAMPALSHRIPASRSGA